MSAPWDNGVKRKGFGNILYYGGAYWGVPDLQRESMLANASVPSTARIIRSVIENTPLDLMSDQDGGTWALRAMRAARIARSSRRSLQATHSPLCLTLSPTVKRSRRLRLAPARLTRLGYGRRGMTSPACLGFSACTGNATSISLFILPGLQCSLWVGKASLG